MIKASKEKLPWLLLPIESRARELDANILLSCFAAEAGYGVIIGQNTYIDDLIEYLPKGIYLAKGMTTSKSQLAIIKRLKRAGNDYACLDEEGLVYEEEAYFRYRLSWQNLEETKIFFTWGEKQTKNILNKFPQFVNKIAIVGNPRVDLWRPELREYFYDKVVKIRSIYGPYILIASNFSNVNYFHKLDFVLAKRKKEGIVRSFEDEDYFRKRYSYKLQLFEKFLDLIKIISKKFPNYKIIIRPHPAEKHDLWEKTFKGLSNVKVVYEGSVTPWILGADALIHDSCTTGIEGYLLDIPVFSYRPYTSEKFDSYLPLVVSRKVSDTDSLVNLLKEVSEKKISNLVEDSDKIRSILKNHIASLDGIFAGERIVKDLKKIYTRKQSLYYKYGNFLLIKPKIERFIKEAIKDTFLLIPEAIRPFFIRERLSAWSNQRKRFSPTNTNEIRKNIEKFSMILKRFKRVRVYPICKNCFCIINDI